LRSARRASIWGSHIETTLKKQQLRRQCRSLFMEDGGPRPASRALPAAAAAAAAAACSLLAVLLLLLQLLQLLLLLLNPLLLLLL
jgi:hypothetical protein